MFESEEPINEVIDRIEYYITLLEESIRMKDKRIAELEIKIAEPIRRPLPNCFCCSHFKSGKGGTACVLCVNCSGFEDYSVVVMNHKEESK